MRAQRIRETTADGVARRVEALLHEVRAEGGTWLLEVDRVPHDVVLELEARLAETAAADADPPGSARRLDARTLAEWEREAADEAAEAWKDLGVAA